MLPSELNRRRRAVPDDPLRNATPVSSTATTIDDVAPGLMSQARSMSMSGKVPLLRVEGIVRHERGMYAVARLRVLDVGTRAELPGHRLRVGIIGNAHDLEVRVRRRRGRDAAHADHRGQTRGRGGPGPELDDDAAARVQGDRGPFGRFAQHRPPCAAPSADRWCEGRGRCPGPSGPPRATAVTTASEVPGPRNQASQAARATITSAQTLTARRTVHGTSNRGRRVQIVQSFPVQCSLFYVRVHLLRSGSCSTLARSRLT